MYNVKLNGTKKILELDKIDPIESLEPSIQKLVQSMPRQKELKGTIVDICSKINLDIESPQQFGKTLKRNVYVLKKYGIGIYVKRQSKGKIYQLTYDANDVEF